MTSRLLPAYEKSVFINCPFDAEYRSALLAMVFSVASHGFEARSAREAEGDGEPRFSRILAAIAGSKYSIHDLSRYTGEGGDNLARFNFRSNSGWPPHFAMSVRSRAAHRTDGSPSSRKATPISGLFPISPASILPGTTHRRPRLSGHCPLGCTPWRTSPTRYRRHCPYCGTFPLSRAISPI